MNIFKKTVGSGKDVLILHGWGGIDHKYMQPIVEQLASRYRVTSIDLPGQGQSSWHPDIQNMDDIADQLLSSLPKQAIYIGWSFGGAVAMSIAARYPERINQLIGIGTTPKFVASDYWPGVPRPGFQASFIPAIEENGWSTFIRGWVDFEFADFESKPTKYHDLISMLDKDVPKVNTDILFKGVYIIDATDLRKPFQSIACPIDLIMGEQDDAIPIECHEVIKQLNPKVSIRTIPKAKHMPFWTHPHEFSETLNHIL